MGKIKSFKFFPSFGVCYQPFGKTGNTTILRMILDALESKGLVLSESGTVHTILNDSTQQVVCKFEDARSTDIFLEPNIKYVTSVRNPYTRTLSLYLHITGNGVRELPDKWAKKLQCSRSKHLSFQEFLEQLLKVGANNIDGHTASIGECSLIGDADYDHVIKFEDFESGVKRMFRDLFGFDAVVPHVGVSTSSNKKVYDFYSQECIDLVRRIYAKDFDVLGYSLDISDACAAPDIPSTGKSIHKLYKEEVSK